MQALILRRLRCFYYYWKNDLFAKYLNAAFGSTSISAFVDESPCAESPCGCQSKCFRKLNSLPVICSIQYRCPILSVSLSIYISVHAALGVYLYCFLDMLMHSPFFNACLACSPQGEKKHRLKSVTNAQKSIGVKILAASRGCIFTLGLFHIVLLKHNG